jgi:two-component system, LytTR family, sensor kinase
MRGKKIILIYLVWWAFCFAVQSAVFIWLKLGIKISLTDSAVSSSLLLVCGHATSNFYRHFQPGKANRFHRLLWGLALTAACVAAQYHLLLWLFPNDVAYQNFMEGSVPIRFLFSLLIIAFMTLITWLWSYMEEKQEQELRRVDAENLSKEAELARLRQQLQPHFLFNSLNSVNALIAFKPDEARTMIQQLSDFMRLTLRKDDKLVPFSEEMEHLQLYLGIEKIRFGHRLDVKISVDDEAGKMLVPPLLLQPIAENAIKFGLYNTTGEVEIKITATGKNGILEIVTQNPFDGTTASPQKGTGFGLSSVQRRLYLLFGRNDLLKTYSRENNFITHIFIPQSK